MARRRPHNGARRFRRGTARELLDGLGEPRGEYTLVVAPPEVSGAAAPDDVRFDIARLVRALLAQGVTTKVLAPYPSGPGHATMTS